MAESLDNVVASAEIPSLAINLELPGLDRSPPRKPPLPLQIGKWRHLRVPLRRLIRRASRNI